MVFLHFGDYLMKDKPNEWVSISDLMAGVMAVVMLLLVMSVLQKTYSDMKHQEEMAKATKSDRQKVSSMLLDVKVSLENTGAEGLASFDLNSGTITLRDSVFSRGSACITDQATLAFMSIADKVSGFLKEFPNGKVFVEGHTDNLPVSRPVINFEQFCTVYDDNFTLSAARAREARKLLVAGADAVDARRVVVAGYGESQPLLDVPPEDARNRRVEVHFSVHQVSNEE